MRWEDEPDEVLMTRYGEGDARAFETLYGRHKAPLYRFLLRQCREQGAAEELFQEVWFKIIRARTRYRVEARFTTYLYQVARNTVIDRYRSTSADPMAGSSDLDSLPELMDRASPSPEHRIDIDNAMARLQSAIDQLPADQREAFLLREEGGFSLEQIAEITGVGRETAKSRLRYAAAKLRRDMETSP